MKQSIILLLAVLLLAGCSTSSISTVPKTVPNRPYARILTVFVDSDMDFYRLDAETYENYLAKCFNDLDHLQYRQQLERTFERNLTAAGTSIVRSSDVFEVNTEFSYDAFMNKVKETGAEAILLINLRNYWYSYSNNDDRDNSEPNASFNCYLVDLKTLEPVWLARSVVNGIIAGYDTINNNLARRVAAKLQKERYIYRPQY